MLETPLYGKFIGENRKLVFAPTGPYYVLVRACLYGGAGATILGILAPIFNIELPVNSTWWVFVGLMVAGAGVLGLLSLQMVIFDLKERTYRRRQGPGAFPATVRGSLNELDAVVLIAEPNAALVRGGVTYHLVLHWKGQRQPPLVLQNETRVVGGGPLNSGAAVMLQLGSRYAASMGLPFYDNSHFPSPNPVPILH